MTRETDVFLEGINRPVGRLTGAPDLSLSFRYSADGLSANRALSLSLPVREEAYGDPAARAFFGNLLNENNALDSVMARHGIARNDIAGLLFHLGRDCPGALSCVPPGEGPSKQPGQLDSDYKRLSDSDLGRIMADLRERRRLPGDLPDPSPLAGVQGKIALTQLPDGGFGLPKPGLNVPTTHILKVPRAGEESLVDQENMLLALGRETLDRNQVSVAEPLICGDERGLLIARFDRAVQHNSVRRLHQEDFAQALGLPESLKYERNSAIAGRIFSAAAVGGLLGRLASPAVARLQFLEATLFNLAVGNTDNHAKNHALLYEAGRAAPTIAPLYDLVPILLDSGVNHDFAFRMGNAERMEHLRADDIHAFCRAIGFPAGFNGTLRSRASALLQSVADAIEPHAGGQKLLGDMIADQVLRLSDILELDVTVPERDLFVQEGGGFRISS